MTATFRYLSLGLRDVQLNPDNSNPGKLEAMFTSLQVKIISPRFLFGLRTIIEKHLYFIIYLLLFD